MSMVTPPAGLPEEQPSEPLSGPALALAALNGVIGLLVAFGVHLTAGQQAAILTVAGSLSALGVWVCGRRKVWSPQSVARLMQARRPG